MIMYLTYWHPTMTLYILLDRLIIIIIILVIHDKRNVRHARETIRQIALHRKNVLSTDK